MRVILQSVIPIVILAGIAGAATFRAIYAAEPPAVDEVLSTKKVMDKVGLGKQSLLSVINRDLKKAEPDWKSDEEKLTETIRLMSMLTKQKPPRGSQDAWDKLVQDYVAGVKAARQNVREHRSQPALAALDKARSACEECHDNHGIK
jgi:hypothetical protein